MLRERLKRMGFVFGLLALLALYGGWLFAGPWGAERFSAVFGKNAHPPSSAPTSGSGSAAEDGGSSDESLYRTSFANRRHVELPGGFGRVQLPRTFRVHAETGEGEVLATVAAEGPGGHRLLVQVLRVEDLRRWAEQGLTREGAPFGVSLQTYRDPEYEGVRLWYAVEASHGTVYASELLLRPTASSQPKGADGGKLGYRLASFAPTRAAADVGLLYLYSYFTPAP
ncbi:hypothetical protein [Brockia lithotrophica]|uniref:Uncharacterized protein n=1 Tax=Brockia lithotrophica TaxID=933949 RepID=A0A660L4W7_9BACL|nr:hypothetical protein [Brockia lithotrophica]RKQ89081.1 hypothetical protein C7438_0737 [Brockia lithotrophica]